MAVFVLVGVRVAIGGIDSVEIGVLSIVINSLLIFGVMVGTGVNRLFATTVAREAISATSGSRSNKTSIMSSILTFRNRYNGSSAL